MLLHYRSYLGEEFTSRQARKRRMMKVRGRCISVIGSIILVASLHSSAVSGPFVVVEQFQKKMGDISSFSAVIERSQQFRSVTRASSGNLKFDRHYGSVYTWEAPGKYRFFRSVFGACGIDLNKQSGWKTTVGTPDPSVAQEIDPFFRLTRLSAVALDKLLYRGNRGDALIFSMTLSFETKLFISFDAVSGRCLVTEVISDKGTVLEKTKFIYHDTDAGKIIPDAMVVSRVVGSELSVDSLAFKKQEFNRRMKKELFTIPQDITWNDKVQLTSFQY